MQTPQIYGLEQVIPPEVIPVRLGIQGEPGTGKTISAATFPNPVWLELENSLNHQEKALREIHKIELKSIRRIKFWDKDVAAAYLKSRNIFGSDYDGAEKNGVINTKLAIKLWIRDEAPKLLPEDTLVVDTWTELQAFFDLYDLQFKWYTGKGEENPYVFWDKKIDYSEEVMGYLEKLKCNVVVLFHEAKERDKVTGQLLDKTQPVQQGKFITRIKKYFPNYYRSLVREITDGTGKPQIDLETKKVRVEYLWQTSADRYCDTKNSITKLPTYVPAHYSSLKTL